MHSEEYNDCISLDSIQQPKRSVDMFSYLLLKRSRGKQLKKNHATLVSWRKVDADLSQIYAAFRNHFRNIYLFKYFGKTNKHNMGYKTRQFKG